MINGHLVYASGNTQYQAPQGQEYHAVASREPGFDSLGCPPFLYAFLATSFPITRHPNAK